MASPSEFTADDSSRALLRRARRRLEAADREAPRRWAEWLLMEVMEWDRGQLYARRERPVPSQAARRFWKMVDRCVAGEPLQHVLGYTSFYGLRIEVSPAVMIPRPETEEVVEVALDRISSVDAPKVLDVGTGSGCIALAIKTERPDAEVWGWDVSAEALTLARLNATKLGTDVSFTEVDILSEHKKTPPAPVDLLISNPPYIPRDEADTLSPKVRDYDPDVALFTGDDPLQFYRILAARVDDFCAQTAAVVFETHTNYAHAAADVLRDEGLRDVSITEDLDGHPRILTARYGGSTGA